MVGEEVEVEEMRGTVTEEIICENPCKIRNRPTIAALNTFGFGIINNISIRPTSSVSHSRCFSNFEKVKSNERRLRLFICKMDVNR